MSTRSSFMISAAHKSSGKTVISAGLSRALSDRGADIATFKKGPDYIDPMWLAAAGRKPCYNLDFNVQSRDEITGFFAAKGREVSLVEANKGLFDGVDPEGSDSNAELAKLLDIPVVLVIDTNGMTRGIAPLLQGYLAFDQKVRIAGVILNKVGGKRHEAKLRQAVETYTGLPVFGAIHRDPALDIGERHLGLLTPGEVAVDALIDAAAQAVEKGVDLDLLLTATRDPRPLASPPETAQPEPDLRIGIARDKAFGFYYADDLETFAEQGAVLVDIDFTSAPELPPIDALFIGGGFPEVQMAALSANESLRADIRIKAASGLPIYAECGGLMYLCNHLSWQGQNLPMAAVIPADAVMNARPQGRGYLRFRETDSHLWPMSGTEYKAHEFHYASLKDLPDDTVYARSITRGYGIDGARDAVVLNNVVAGFTHLRNTKATPWIAAFLNFARQNRP